MATLVKRALRGHVFCRRHCHFVETKERGAKLTHENVKTVDLNINGSKPKGMTFGSDHAIFTLEGNPF
jgi:hypothetical protein